MAASEVVQKSTIVEEREEVMIDPTGSPDQTPSLRIAHFLKPTFPLTSTPPTLPKIQSFSLTSNPNVTFLGRPPPHKGWVTWVQKLEPIYGPAWRKAGIFDAIKASTYHIRRDNELVLRLSERWCPETNTFVFSWGEVTVTLEDVRVLGGFSTLGESVLGTCSLGQKVEQVGNKLLKFVRKLREKHVNVTHSFWQEHFMGSGDELEHAAFLALWLSRHVFPMKSQIFIRQALFPLAASLSCGIKVALAPAILASIYRDLTLLKDLIVSLSSGESDDDEKDDPLVLLAPFQLVQLWGWERFPELAPVPKMIQPGGHRVSRWADLSRLKAHSLGVVLDSSWESYRWRPYAVSIANWQVPGLYGDAGKWVNVDSSEGESESFARCLRVCRLEGMDCVEIYQPHRVAMQFGIDQDVPNPIPQLEDVPMAGMTVYVPPRLFEADVSVRYSDWWKSQSVLQEANDVHVNGKRKLMTPSSDCKSAIPRLSTHRVVSCKKHQLTGPSSQKELNDPIKKKNRRGAAKGSATIIGNEQEEECSCRCESHRLEMEGRISELERLVSELLVAKSDRLGNDQ